MPDAKLHDCILLVVDASRHLLDTNTDRDSRREMLANVDLAATISSVRDQHRASPYPNPVTAPVLADLRDVLHTMEEQRLAEVRPLNEEQRVVGVVTKCGLMPDLGVPLEALVMADGESNRLRTLTADPPQPMLPMGDRPLVERIIT